MTNTEAEKERAQRVALNRHISILYESQALGYKRAARNERERVEAMTQRDHWKAEAEGWKAAADRWREAAEQWKKCAQSTQRHIEGDLFID